ncbi:hypothetical protein [Flavobacterium lindanitolerans]|uniref:hypothetical protein n=1 Tax=Flavobacterium lindanitolerans TaxID=428988 RepID=UPI0023F45706|nr:hypothetical protein [Flavobacterium lindanitolerans]
METSNTKPKSSVPESEELIDRAKTLREKSRETSNKLEKMLENGQKFLHDRREGQDDELEQTEPS